MAGAQARRRSPGGDQPVNGKWNHKLGDDPVTRWEAISVLCATALSVPLAPVHGQETGAADTASTPVNWTVSSAPHIDLWYHGMAVIGFDESEDLPLYNQEYVDRIRKEKQRRGIYPTPLDELVKDLQKEFKKDPAFQNMHFLPLYFPEATRQEMHGALMAVSNRQTDSLRTAGRSTRAGIRMAAGIFDSGNQRKRLRQFVEALDREWTVFFSHYRETLVAALPSETELQRRWDRDILPAARGFAQKHKLNDGRVFVSPALGPEGRLVQGSSVRRAPHMVAVWWPGWDDLDPSLYAAVREMCFAAVDDALRGAAPREDIPDLTGPAAVRCGSLLFEENNPDQVGNYQRSFLRASGDFIDYANDAELARAFEEAYPLNEELVEAVAAELGLPGRERARAKPAPRWVVQARPATDLWFHALAVVQADQPGPLALYSADYATRIRSIKQELGVYPTLLDSIAPDLRKQIADDRTFDIVHFLPLYFPRLEPGRLIETIRSAIDNRPNPRRRGQDPNAGLGMLQLNFAMENGRVRRVMRTLTDAVENEWEVFYKAYAERLKGEQETRYMAIQSMWDSLFVPQLGSYLTRRRLAAGMILPSPAIGPEGRIIDGDGFNPGDQVVAVQLPLADDGPAPTVFAFLKELCFLLIDDREIVPFLNDRDDIEELDDLRRRAAVRCGYMLLELYAPTLVGQYRRVFLDAVGAEESSTASAFERVYPLDPRVFERLRSQIRGG